MPVKAKLYKIISAITPVSKVPLKQCHPIGHMKYKADGQTISIKIDIKQKISLEENRWEEYGFG